MDESARKVISLLDEMGYQAFIARMTSEDDYCGQLPGDGYHGVRQYLLSAVNLSHLFNFHSPSIGRRQIESPSMRENHALSYVVSSGKTLYHLNLNDEPRDVFHHFGIGATGSGKSVALAFLAAQWVSRIPNAGFTAIDRGRSLYRLTRFLGGEFYDLLGANSPGFALFSDVDDPQIAREVLDLLSGFITIQGVTLTPQRSLSLESTMNVMIKQPKHLRSLSNFCKFLQDPEGVLKPALKIYTREGMLGSTLDCETDSFSTSRFTVLEIGSLIGLREQMLIPVLATALFKSRTQIRAMKRKTQQTSMPWLFSIDEAHSMLKHPLGKRFIVETLKMGRKEGMALGLWSNSVTDFRESPLINDMLEACRTRFFFRSTSDDPRTLEAYEALGLPPRGIEHLPNIAPHAMLLHQPSSRELQEISLALDPAWIAIIGRSRDHDHHHLDRLIEQSPQHWREELLRQENVSSKVIEQLAEYRNRANPFDQDLLLSRKAS